jgi:putative chitinase
MNYLIEYQKSRGLTPDGIIGKHTAAVMMKELNIATSKQFAMFISQVQHESANFSAGRENLNYGLAALQSKFKKYFPNKDFKDYARKPEKIANRIYANRMGNGNEASGEGWLYRGGGGLQITGKNNYIAYFKSRGLPANTCPDIITEPEHYFAAGKWFFDINDVWRYCSAIAPTNILIVSKIINLGNKDTDAMPFGFEDRFDLTMKNAKAIV